MRRSAKTDAPWVAILVCALAWAACLPLGFLRLLILDVLLTGLSILLEFAALVRKHRGERAAKGSNSASISSRVP